jgi:hypothetical protein
VTTLVVWVSFDQRAPSALYMASDSRISWGSEHVRWDAGRKLFACRRHPDIFGYTGDVVFPSLVLGQIVEAMDSGLLIRDGDDSEARHSKIVAAVKRSADQRHNAPTANFSIVHASRQFAGPRAEFRLWQLSFDATAKSWSELEITVPPGQSSLLVAIGTGARSAKAHHSRWETSAQGGTSRAIFGAFCDSLKSQTDPLSGGVPQLVGMYHTRMPQAFGLVLNGGRYFHGLPLPSELNPNDIEWRDELFQRMDGRTLQVAAGAQRHARPKLTK